MQHLSVAILQIALAAFAAYLIVHGFPVWAGLYMLILLISVLP